MSRFVKRLTAAKQSTFTLPLVIGVLSLVGLFAALLGNGGYHVLAWLTLAAPVLATGWAWMSQKR